MDTSGPLAKQNVPIDRELYNSLRALKVREGIPISESVRRALKAYLQARGELDSPRPPHLDVHA